MTKRNGSLGVFLSRARYYFEVRYRGRFARDHSSLRKQSQIASKVRYLQKSQSMINARVPMSSSLVSQWVCFDIDIVAFDEACF